MKNVTKGNIRSHRDWSSGNQKRAKSTTRVLQKIMKQFRHALGEAVNELLKRQLKEMKDNDV